MLFKLFERGLGLISTLVLARFLVPDDFGLVVIATTFVALLDLMRAFGFDMALIHLRQVTRAHFDTAWTFSALLGVLIASLLFLLGPSLAAFYGDPRLKAVLWALAFASLFNGFESNGPVMFRKELQWKQDFWFQITRKFAAVMFTIPLAILWQNYWALVAGTIAGRFASMVVSYLVTPHRPRFCLSERRQLWSFSKWTFITNILVFVRQRLPNLMIGKMTSTANVGLFGMARDISRLLTTELVSPINRAAFPGYAKIADDVPRLQQGFLKMLGAIALVVVPAGIGVALVAEPAVRILLGERWSDSVPALQVLSVYGAIGGLQGNANAVYLAIGRPRLQSVMLVVFVVVLIPAVIILTPAYGHVGAAIAYLIAGAIAVPYNLANICTCLAMPKSSLLGVLWRPFFASAVMALTVIAATFVIPWSATWFGALVKLFVLACTGGATYVAALAVAWHAAGKRDGAERWALDQARAKFARM